MRGKIRVVMTRGENIKEILVNHKKEVEEFGKEESRCVCRKKKRYMTMKEEE